MTNKNQIKADQVERREKIANFVIKDNIGFIEAIAIANNIEIALTWKNSPTSFDIQCAKDLLSGRPPKALNLFKTISQAFQIDKSFSMRLLHGQPLERVKSDFAAKIKRKAKRKRNANNRKEARNSFVENFNAKIIELGGKKIKHGTLFELYGKIHKQYSSYENFLTSTYHNMPQPKYYAWSSLGEKNKFDRGVIALLQTKNILPRNLPKYLLDKIKVNISENAINLFSVKSESNSIFLNIGYDTSPNDLNHTLATILKKQTIPIFRSFLEKSGFSNFAKWLDAEKDIGYCIATVSEYAQEKSFYSSNIDR